VKQQIFYLVLFMPVLTLTEATLAAPLANAKLNSPTSGISYDTSVYNNLTNKHTDFSVPLRAAVSPTLVSCPVGNCPAPNRVLTAMNLYGQTQFGADIPEWESVIGLLSTTGDPNGQKVVQYLGGMQAPGSGSLWTLNTNIVRNAVPIPTGGFVGQPGSEPGAPGGIGASNSTIGYELDLSNWSEDDKPGGPFVVGMFINTLSSFSSLAGIYYGAGVYQKVPSWHNGIIFSKNTVKDNSVYDGSEASYSYQVGGTHTSAFYDNSNSKQGLAINGSHSQQDILLLDSPPVGIALTGNYKSGAITMNPGQKVCFGQNSCVTFDGNKWHLSNAAGQNVASIDSNGNMTLKGKLIQNGVP